MSNKIYISNCCPAGYIDNILERHHLCPFIWIGLSDIEMINFYENFNNIDFSKIDFIPFKEWRKKYPNPEYHWKNNHVSNDEDRISIIVDNKVTIAYPHYSINNKDKFIELYYKRLERFNSIENKDIVFIYQTYNNESDDVYYRFLELKNKKILIDNKHQYHKNHIIKNLDYFTVQTIYNLYNPEFQDNSTYFINWIKNYDSI